MTRQRGLLMAMTMATIAFSGAGCATSDPVMAPPGGALDPLARQDYPRIVAVDNLNYHLFFEQPDVRPSTDNRPMEVIVGVRLARDVPLAIQYAFQFFDETGRPLGPSDRWQWKHLDPRVQFFLEGNAMETSAADWRLQVRSAR